ncbi:zinc-binding dehydrogenase family protein [Mycobacterium ulcerans str. Harvey]|uniref:Zinc-binding dehydrogenase family protein n=1 Tax=Mycobacterium ulcerans str. Harvey TaxID=1299332 RepID=A0ABP3AQS2_MYCUL|nr:zinc-binding dehydrogenase family protein [Mycobacterium ulcerans str. Harvey]
MVEPGDDRAPGPGQLVLIHGGACGIGSHAIQVCTALGARVAVTAGSSEKLQLSRDLGAQITINYRDEDFVARLKQETDGSGADVILDIMGAPTWTATSTRWPWTDSW